MRPRVLHGTFAFWTVCLGGRFTALFLEKEAQLSASQIGLALALQLAIVSLVASPGGLFADYLENKYPNSGRLIVLTLGVILAMVSTLAQYPVSVYCDGHSLVVGFLILRCIFSVGYGVLTPVIDGLTLTYLKDNGLEMNDYGQERLHGAIWWAVASVGVGFLLDVTKADGFKIFYGTTFVASIMNLISIYLYWSYYSTPASKRGVRHSRIDNKTMASISHHQSIDLMIDEEGEDIDEDTEEENDGEIVQHSRLTSWQLFLIICGSIYGAGFMLSSILLTMGTSIVEHLIFLYFEELGASNTLCGFTVVVTVLFEFPVFHLSSYLLSKWGAVVLQLIACVGYIFRVVGYTFIPPNAPYLVLLFEPFHGITYGCNKIAMVEFVAQLSPKGYEASGQGLLTLLTGCFGSFFGLLLGGHLSDFYGDIVMYRTFAFIVTVGLIIFDITRRYKRAEGYDEIL